MNECEKPILTIGFSISKYPYPEGEKFELQMEDNNSCLLKVFSLGLLSKKVK